jgi:lysophospholipase L1-like esterase
MKIIISITLLIAIVYAGYEYIRIQNLIGKSKVLIAAAVPYQNATGTISILVIGDSTAAGVGASSPSESTAGLLGASLHASVENHAVSGAVTADMQGQLAQAKLKHYDLVLIQDGANDVVSFHSLANVNMQMQALLSNVQHYSDHVVLLTAGKIGDAPLIPWLFSGLINARAAKLQSLFTASAAQAGAAYVDLSGSQSDAFSNDPAKYYAADTFHPSSAGYALWFDAIKETIAAQWPGVFNGYESQG